MQKQHVKEVDSVQGRGVGVVKAVKLDVFIAVGANKKANITEPC